MAICESCGREEPSVAKVQRMYLVEPTDSGEPAGQSPRELEPQEPPTAGDIELWCASCCATFPHVSVDAR